MNDFVAPGDPERAAYVVGLVRERVDPSTVRVLDLGCRTGAFSTALADAGAQVVGVEGRPENFGRIPAHPNARFELGDVRDVSVERHGNFDVTLCLGILYHLDAVDAVRLLKSMRQITTRFAIIDTHSGRPDTTVEVDGVTYSGHWYGEPPGLWSSIGNPNSWWFTPASLDDAIRVAGWDHIEYLEGVRWSGEPSGRHWLAIS